ncbi:MAG: PLP-dependent aminotransferase family protein [Clostridia bacterium]|nr:PLP-dependent aminotransferase family protein [Clostridia bacterium]
MNIKIDRDSKIPVYIQIRDQIRSMILDNSLTAGCILPPERKLADSMGINRSTVLNAYRELKADGLVDSHVGKGTIVLSHLSQVSNEYGVYEPPVWRQFFSQMAERSGGPLLRELLEAANRDDVISFAAGISSYETDPVEALRGIEAELSEQPGHFALKHTPTEGFSGLRESIAGLMQKKGIGCTAEEVLVLSGSQQGIDLAARVFIDPGDVVIVEEPSFFCALQIFQAVGARVIGIPVDYNGMRVDLLEQALQRYRPKFIYTMPTYQNPSGVSMSLERRKALIELAYRKKTLILEDDPYGELRFEGGRIPTLKELDKYGYIIYLSTFSKILFPGIRIGWMVAPKPVISQFSMVKQMSDLHANSISQWLVDRFIRSGLLEPHLKKICCEYREKRDIMIDALLEYPQEELVWNKPLGGFYLWCRLPEEIPHSSLLAKAAENGVVYVPGTTFYIGARGGNYIRLNYTYPDKDSIRPGIQRLCKSITETLSGITNSKKLKLIEIRPIV